MSGVMRLVHRVGAERIVHARHQNRSDKIIS